MSTPGNSSTMESPSPLLHARTLSYAFACTLVPWYHRGIVDYLDHHVGNAPFDMKSGLNALITAQLQIKMQHFLQLTQHTFSPDMPFQNPNSPPKNGFDHLHIRLLSNNRRSSVLPPFGNLVRLHFWAAMLYRCAGQARLVTWDNHESENTTWPALQLPRTRKNRILWELYRSISLDLCIFSTHWHHLGSI